MSKESFVDEQYKLYVAKNTLYGDSFVNSIKKFGNVAFTVRISDKMERIKQLLSEKDLTDALEVVNDEKVEDTIRDLFNYTCMFISFRSSIDVKEVMNTVIESPEVIFTYLCMPFGDFNNSVLEVTNPNDIELFSKIKQILLNFTL